MPEFSSEMVAAEQHALARQPDLIRHTAYHVTKLSGAQSGVAPVLVHLVGSGFDQCVAAEIVCMLQGRAQHERMRRADRIDASRLAGAGPPQQLEQGLHFSSSGSMASSTAARKASPMAVNLSGCGMMPRTASAMTAVMS